MNDPAPRNPITLIFLVYLATLILLVCYVRVWGAAPRQAYQAEKG